MDIVKNLHPLLMFFLFFRSRHLFLTAIFLVISLSGIGQSLSYGIDSITNGYIDRGDIAGAVIKIIHRGQVVHSGSYGYARIFDGPGIIMTTPVKMTEAHLFDIASLTKVIGTTTGIMLLYERGLIDIGAPVSKYIHGFRGTEKEKVTIRHLLQHTAGLYEWYPMYYKAKNHREVYHLINKLPLPYTVGAKRRYSDLGFTLLGQLIEVVGKMPLEDFLRKNVFDPLGMKNTFFLPPGSSIPSLVAATSVGNPYEKRMVHDPSLGFQFPEIDPDSWNSWRTTVLAGQVNDGNAWYAGRGVSGAAGLFSTADDLSKFLNMLISGGSGPDGIFLSRKTLDEFLKKDKFLNGLGWVMDPESSFMRGAPEGSFGHTGFTGTSVVVVPSSQLAVIILSNRQQTGLKDDLTYSNINPLRQAIFELALKFK
ncbi:MAG: serine hydrolase domain-containing protein [Cyclobacteriaceae bacterium]